MFFKGSRYAKVGDDQIQGEQGRTMSFKKVRFIADTPAVLNHTVAQGERLDQIAQIYYKDPLVFWRICDSNRALLPEDLVKRPGAKVGIPASEA